MDKAKKRFDITVGVREWYHETVTSKYWNPTYMIHINTLGSHSLSILIPLVVVSYLHYYPWWS